jgi:hypothetical protein
VNASAGLLELQRLAGNRAVSAMLRGGWGPAMNGGAKGVAFLPPRSQPAVQRQEEGESVRHFPRVPFGGNSGHAVRERDAVEIVRPTIFGHQPEGGVVSGFANILTRAEADAKVRIEQSQQASGASQAFTEADWDVNNVKGKHVGGWHTSGVAIDLDYARNPYVANEGRGRKADEDESALVDSKTKPIYNRVALLYLGRRSVTQDGALKQGEQGKDRYDKLKAESDCMEFYFAMMDDKSLIQNAVDDADAQWSAAVPDYWKQVFDGQEVPRDQRAARLQPIIKHDYQGLSTPRSGVAGDSSIPALPSKMDRPGDTSEGHDMKHGFLHIRKEIVEALRGQGLRWGGTDFGAQNGDIMHFDAGHWSGETSETRALRAAAQAKWDPPTATPAPVQTYVAGDRTAQPVVQRHEAGDDEVVADEILHPPELEEEGDGVEKGTDG